MTRPVNSIQNPIVFFDGVCGLCNKFVDFLLKRDKREWILFAPLQGKTAQKYNLSEKEYSSVVLLYKGKEYYRSTAAIKILVLLGGVFQFSIIFLIIPSIIRNYFYDFVASRRYKWFRKEECRVPSKEEKERFLP